MFRGMLPLILLTLIMSVAHANAGKYDGIYKLDHPEGGIWEYANGTASVSFEGNYLGISCETFNPSSTLPVANLFGPCPGCILGDKENFSFVVDGGQAQVFLFEKQSNADGWKSSLEDYPIWYGGFVSSLMGGNSLSIYEQDILSASFSLTGSSKALKQLRLYCN